MELEIFTKNGLPVDFDPFAGPEILLIAPATEPQIEIWTSCLIGGSDASCAYNDSASLLLTGPFDDNAMRLALQALSDRHEALRTVFSGDGKTICVYNNPKISFDYHDISTQEAEQNASFIQNYARQNAITPMDLVYGPLFKTALFKLNNDEHYLTFIAHHIICDGWSVGVILQDLSKLYTAFAKGIEPILPPAPQFSDYAVDQSFSEEDATLRENEAFWIDQFKGSDHLLNLPTDNPRPTYRTFKSNRADFNLEANLVNDIKKMARKAGSSFVTALLAAFEVFLQQITTQDEIILGLPSAGQSATGNYGLVGHCVNLLALRTIPDRELQFVDYLKQRKTAILDAYEHQQYTFGSLLKKLNIPRDASRIPLVPVVFNIDIGMDEGVDFYNLKHQYINNPREYETFEIFLNITDQKDGLILEWSYNSQLFSPETITRMMDEFEYLLRQIVKNPEIMIGRIPTKDAQEIKNKLQLWNNTKVSYPKNKSLSAIISDTVTVNYENVALQFYKQKYTYKQLNEKSNQLAHALIKFGLNKGDRVALLVDRSEKLVVALLAIMKAGGAYIPLDPLFPVNRINYMLTDSDAKLLLTESNYSGQYIHGNEVLLDNVWHELAEYPSNEPDVCIKGDDLLYILYTSGSTGSPKGVQIAHHNVVNFLLSMQKVPGITPQDKLLAVTTISFDIAGLEIFLPLITGAQLILTDAVIAKDGFALLEIIKNQKITLMQATPYTWRILLEAGWQNQPLKAICGGEALPLDLASRILDRASSLWNVYGPTETTIWSTIKEITNADETITIGKPIDNTSIYVLDRFLNPIAPGVAGEIYIGGEGVAKGYWKKPDLTAEKFIDDPFSAISGAKMYRTGDIGTFTSDGELVYLSRTDNQIKIRGYRIETGEIEHYLSKISDIKEAVVVTSADYNGIQKLVAYVVVYDNTLSENNNENISNWRIELHSSLPDYMIPDNFIIISEIPLTPNGKVNKKALITQQPLIAANIGQYISPRTDTEKLVHDIWKEYLEIERISVLDNFFELGGHSLIAVQVMARIEKETGKRLPLAVLFENSTIEKLSLVLQRDGRSITWDSLVPIKPKGNKMPIYIVHGAGLNVLLFNTLAKHMDDDQPVYGLQAKGLNGVDEPLNRIEDIAAHYISSIMSQNPDGPYALAGFSFGGIIAFEMARQLEALNKEVKMLAMFDTYAYRTPHYDPWLLKHYKRGMYFGRKLWYSVTFQEGFIKTIKHRSKALKRGATRFYWRFRYGKEQKQTGFFGYSNKIDQMNDIAQKHYRIQPYEITIELFRAEVRSFYLDDFEYMGWKPYALKGINIHNIPGEHNTIFKDPNDKVFAKILQECLDKAVKR
ncbi:non-ribosomal peptide synthetase [Mucilaginibacter segetis]|uniref:Amino acid adenylation domain-containing protein n=1 Tax=Mucilaginibacter segetis TaxID=2793071 RepID=A0A934PT56_9SPHI|nr:non-ribosomal peptide synthetase [Mucilaginibacter segetis]MBK0379127.1 amino acid adenylation domain-containing protein [Mucilaginibacter segetis]